MRKATVKRRVDDNPSSTRKVVCRKCGAVHTIPRGLSLSVAVCALYTDWDEGNDRPARCMGRFRPLT